MPPDRRRIAGFAAKVEKVLAKHGLTFQDIKGIVITHAHVNHAGGAAELRARSRLQSSRTRMISRITNGKYR